MLEIEDFVNHSLRFLIWILSHKISSYLNKVMTDYTLCIFCAFLDYFWQRYLIRWIFLFPNHPASLSLHLFQFSSSSLQQRTRALYRISNEFSVVPFTRKVALVSSWCISLGVFWLCNPLSSQSLPTIQLFPNNGYNSLQHF